MMRVVTNRLVVYDKDSNVMRKIVITYESDKLKKWSDVVKMTANKFREELASLKEISDIWKNQKFQALVFNWQGQKICKNAASETEAGLYIY